MVYSESAASPSPLCVLWVCTRQADGDGGGSPDVVSLHHLPAHFHLHQGRMHQPRQQPHGRLQRFREETGEGKVVRHVPAAPAVFLVKPQVDPSGQGAVAVGSQGGRAVQQAGQTQQGQEEEHQSWSGFESHLRRQRGNTMAGVKIDIFWRDLQFTQRAKFKNRNGSVSVVPVCSSQ